MSRYIDYDAIDYRNDKMHDKSSDFIDGVIYMAQRIEEAPSIDIVRCAECKWADKCSQNVAMRDTYEMYEKIDFCSYGERNDNEF